MRAIRLFVLQISKKNVCTDNHSGISAGQRDSNVSMTDIVSTEDDVNLQVSTGLSAAIDEGCRRLRLSPRAIRLFVLQTAKKNVYTDNHSGISARQHDSNVSMTDLVSAEDDVILHVSTGLSAAIDEWRRRRR